MKHSCTETSVTAIVRIVVQAQQELVVLLITVTTAGAHGFELGDAVTIKGLKQDVQGYSRAEGAFIIILINAISFPILCKSKSWYKWKCKYRSPSNTT